MIKTKLDIQLPPPWETGSFRTSHIGEINYLVGPNGSGKSQFAQRLHDELRNLNLRPRLLGTDRLTGMERVQVLSRYVGDPFQEGIDKNRFEGLKQAGGLGAGIDAIVLLEERMDLLIQVEGTLSQLFNREVILEWDSGRLIPKARRRDGNVAYRLDREECHGIKELLVLLTHLYDDRTNILIIDEPELNLHPQFQAFFLEEVRKIAGNPTTDSSKKAVFLVTHSPFVLDLQSTDDLNSVISFDLEYEAPKQVYGMDVSCTESFVKRMNAHHKQLFFSDSPIFVEGIFDAWIIQGLIESLGASVHGAGSCIIDANGVDEVNQYLKLSQCLGKEAHFLYDLDALFRGTLRRCLRDDETIQDFLVTAGLGDDFAKYCGQLDRKLIDLVDILLPATLTPELDDLKYFLDGMGSRAKWQKEHRAKVRVALLTAISVNREQIVSKSSEVEVADIEARLRQILEALKRSNIHVLPGGTLERYLPLFKGSVFEPTSDQKREAVLSELEVMSGIETQEEMACRYTDLFEAIQSFPSKIAVDLEVVLRRRLSTYIHALQQTVMEHPNWGQREIQGRMNSTLPEYTDVFSIQRFVRLEDYKFQVTILVADLLDQGLKYVEVSDQTNAGMGGFDIKSSHK